MNIFQNVELDFSNYATEADLKNPIRVDTLDFAINADLSNLKSDVKNYILIY